MYAAVDILQSAALLCTALCSAALLYTAHRIRHSLRSSADQLLDFAAELLDLIDPVLPPPADLATPPPASAHVDFFEDAAHPGWNTPLSPAPSSSAPSSPLRELPLFSLDEELSTPGAAARPTPPVRRLSYPETRLPKKPTGIYAYKRPGRVVVPRVSVTMHGKKEGDSGCSEKCV